MNQSRRSRPAPRPAAVQALEQAANDLLRASLHAGGHSDYPFYTERWLREMRRREERSGRVPPPLDAPREPDSGPLLDGLLAQAPLTPQQRAVLGLCREGLTLREIAGRLQRPLSTVGRWRVQGVAVLRRQVERGQAIPASSAAIAQTFREQSTIAMYQPERHCTPGREACREDGCCRYRWYLYQEADE